MQTLHQDVCIGRMVELAPLICFSIVHFILFQRSVSTLHIQCMCVSVLE